MLAEPSRARILLALDDGRALPASMLATEAGIAPSTASGHLARLVEAGFLSVETHGRNRYFRLAGPEIGDVLEAVVRLAPQPPVRSLQAHTRLAALRRARTCYDHLAGRLGVELLDAMLRQALVGGHDGSFRPEHERLSARSRDPIYSLTGQGRIRFAQLGIVTGVDIPLAHCVDWSEQRHHLAGTLGAALADHMFAQRWLERSPVGRSIHHHRGRCAATGRGVRRTRAGRGDGDEPTEVIPPTRCGHGRGTDP